MPPLPPLHHRIYSPFYDDDDDDDDDETLPFLTVTPGQPTPLSITACMTA